MNLSLRRLTSVGAHNNIFAKRQKLLHLTPIAFGRLQITLGQSKTTGIKILFDSGSTQSHIRKECIKNLRLRKDAFTTWTTAAGPVTTSEKCKVLISLPEFFPSKTIEWEMHVGTLKNVRYDMIIGTTS